MFLAIDIVHIERIAGVFSRFPEKFAQRILSAGELRELGEITLRARQVAYLSGRFCAKEAIYKAMNTDDRGRPLTWKRLSLQRGTSGLQVLLDGQVFKPLAVSLSHERDYVVAVALNRDSPSV